MDTQFQSHFAESVQDLLILNESMAQPIVSLSSCIKGRSRLAELGSVSDRVTLAKLFRGKDDGSVILPVWQ